MKPASVKNEKQRQRQRKWAPILRHAGSLGDKEIQLTDLLDMPDLAMKGYPFARSERDQIHNMLVNLTEQTRGGGYRFTPSKIKMVLEHLPPPTPARVVSVEEYLEQQRPATPAPEVTPIVDRSHNVLVKQILILDLKEAERIVGLGTPEGLPDELPPGSATKIGPSMVHMLKSAGLVTSVGKARAARILVDHDRWDETKITVQAYRGHRTQRVKPIPVAHQFERQAGSWMRALIRDLETIYFQHKPSTISHPDHRPPTPAISHTEGRNSAIKFLRDMLEQAEAELSKAVSEAGPYLERLETKKKQVADLNKAIEAVTKSKD